MRRRNFSFADLHKLGGIEAIVSLLDDTSSDAVRAGAAFALGVAASNNEPFVIELTDRGGDNAIIRMVEVQPLSLAALDIASDPQKRILKRKSGPATECEAAETNREDQHVQLYPR